MSEQPADLDPEDAKLVTLARATRTRARAVEGAAVRDLRSEERRVGKECS